MGDGALLEDETEDEGDVFVLDFPGGRGTPMALSAVRAFEEDVLDNAVAVPLTSLSVSSVGSRLTNSFCSNWTTTYGRAWIEDTLSPRAEMSLTWIWPFDVADGADGCAPCRVAVLEEVLVEEDDDDGGLGLFSMESEGCGDFLMFRMEKSGTCRDICVVGIRARKDPDRGVRAPGGVMSACAVITAGDVASRWWWTEAGAGDNVCEPPVCGTESVCCDVRKPGDDGGKVALAAPGTSKGFGRSRPSALARGVSWSSTDGHNLIIALERGENESEGRYE